MTDLAGLNYLGICHQNGKGGLAKDDVKAGELYRQSAACGARARAAATTAAAALKRDDTINHAAAGTFSLGQAKGFLGTGRYAECVALCRNGVEAGDPQAQCVQPSRTRALSLSLTLTHSLSLTLSLSLNLYIYANKSEMSSMVYDIRRTLIRVSNTCI